MSAVKEEVRRIAEDLSEDATWDDVMERIFLKQVLEAGLEAARQGKTRPVSEVRKSYGLPE